MELLDQIAESGALTIVVALVFASGLLLAYGIASIVAARSQERRRLAGTFEMGAGSSTPLRSSAPLTGLAGVLDSIARLILPRGRMEPTTALQRQMIQAGFPNLRAIRIYYVARILLALSLGLLAVAAVPLVQPSAPLQTVALLGLAGGALGFYFPTFYLSRRTRLRQTTIREGFPDALDMLLVCVESGLGLDGALARVSREIGRAHPLLAEHFAFVGNELRVGRDREAALRSMAERIGIDEVSSLVSLLVQTDRLGTSMADALRAHAYEMRNTRMLRAEEKAYKLPVKLSAPLVFFILPALMLVILSPAVLDMGREMFPALKGVDIDALRR